jgi:hypothetical protein
MRLKSNGGTMTVTHKATMPGYHKDVWFSKRAITNIIALIEQYRVTYDCDEIMYVVHRESESKPNMEFRMHESGLHYYDPRKNEQFASSALSPKTRKVSREDTSRVQKPQELCTPR